MDAKVNLRMNIVRNEEKRIMDEKKVLSGRKNKEE